jgi:hypothetical protein
MVGRIRVRYKGSTSMRGNAVIYLYLRAQEWAERAVEEAAAIAKAKTKGASKTEDSNNDWQMDLSLVMMVLASCKVEEQDHQYDNPSQADEAPCTCPLCEKYPRPPHPSPCDCSGCQPELPQPPDVADTDTMDVDIDIHVDTQGDDMEDVVQVKRKGLTREM